MVIKAFESEKFPTYSRALPGTGNDDFDKTFMSKSHSTSFPINSTQRKRLKILPPKKLLRRLPI